MQAQDLDQLTEQFPDCIIAAYADITTGVVYVTGGSLRAPREALNELCADAALTLGLPDVPTIGAEPCSMAVKMVDHAVFIFFRMSEDPGDALLCMCRPEIDTVPFIEAAQKLAGAA